MTWFELYKKIDDVECFVDLIFPLDDVYGAKESFISFLKSEISESTARELTHAVKMEPDHPLSSCFMQ